MRGPARDRTCWLDRFGFFRLSPAIHVAAASHARADLVRRDGASDGTQRGVWCHLSPRLMTPRMLVPPPLR